MDHHFSASRLPVDSKFAAHLPQIPPLSNPRIRRPTARIKNDLRKPAYKFLISCLPAALLTLRPAPCSAAAAELPWDQTLIACQDMLISAVAPAAIALAFSGAVILYALGGHDKQAARLVGSVIGGCVALLVVHLLNYVFP